MSLYISFRLSGLANNPVVVVLQLQFIDTPKLPFYFIYREVVTGHNSMLY